MCVSRCHTDRILLIPITAIFDSRLMLYFIEARIVRFALTANVRLLLDCVPPQKSEVGHRQKPPDHSFKDLSAILAPKSRNIQTPLICSMPKHVCSLLLSSRTLHEHAIFGRASFP